MIQHFNVTVTGKHSSAKAEKSPSLELLSGQDQLVRSDSGVVMWYNKKNEAVCVS